MQCGHIFNSRFEESDADDLYKVHPSTNAPVHESMLQGLRAIAAKIMAGRGSGARVLEIGCGVGALARLLAESASSVDLIEPNLALSKAPFDNPSIRVLPGFFPQATTGLRYDLIVCRQVLEHIARPTDFLAAIRDHLAPGGQAYIEVPSADYILDNFALADFHYLHVQYFTGANFERLLVRVGLQIVNSWSIKDGHDVGYWTVPANPASPAACPPQFNPGEFRRGLEARRRTGADRLAAMSGRIALYGASAYSQALLGMYPDLIKTAGIFDDTESYAGCLAYSRLGEAPVQLPDKRLVSEFGNIVVCTYLHDRVIAGKLPGLGYAGQVHSLRPDAAAGRDAPPSLFR